MMAAIEGTVCADCQKIVPPTPPGHTGGTGLGKYDGKEICYACCGKRDEQSMKDKGEIGLYLVTRDGKRVVGNWPGSLNFPVRGEKIGKHRTFAGFVRRVDAWFNGPDGFVWHAVQRGHNNDIARCKRTKERVR